MANPFSYCELHTDDPSKAKAFYAGLFDWKLSDTPFPGGIYTEIKTGDGIEGGLMKSMAPNVPSHWLTYIKVADLVASTAKAKTLGGKVLVDNQPIPEVGRFSVVADPTGATIGLWEPLKKQ
jgi:predicted enzyme related to lactoylglutathione lyase